MTSTGPSASVLIANYREQDSTALCSCGSLSAETIKFSVSRAAKERVPLFRSELKNRPFGVPAVADADTSTGQVRYLDAVAIGVTERALNPARTRTQPSG